MSEFDYVIVGAGSAGCVIANRLSADPSTRVLLLEAGGSDRSINVRIPAGFPKQFRTDLDWGYVSEPEPNLIGRSMYLPRGRSLGGSSSMNAMIYMRGHRENYDTWASDLGAPGWSYREVLPLFVRSEGNERLGGEYHGQGGPLNVMDPTWVSPLAERFAESAAACGIPRSDDFNGAEQDGAGTVQVTQKRGRRWSAADAFLHPVRKSRENLKVVTGAHVRRIVVDGSGRATGVELDHKGRTATVRARREVILSAGAFNSPQLLMLSGIGPAEHLREVGIAPIVDSPHVGEHLADHAMCTLTWQSSETGLFDATHPRYLLEYVAGRGKGKLSSNVGEAAAHIRTDPSLPAPDFQVLFGPAYYFDNGFRTFPGPAFTLAPCLLRPASEGSVRLRSADPHDAPAIHLNFFGEDGDMQAMLRAIRTAREWAATGPLASFAGVNIDPGPGVASDEQLEAWVRAEVQHEYHPSCTCRIGPDGEGVLDEQLRVRGVEGLRVADASAFPRIPGGNTNAPAIMVGERASDLVLGAVPAPLAAAATT
jgi:choline dehydrogenase-like flavoprotein